MADEKSQMKWISHLVSNLMLPATCETGQGRSAESFKNDLVSQLAERSSGALIDEIRQAARDSDWSTPEGVEAFRENYLQFEERYGINQ